MITRKAYAKINIGLDVLRKREDGYHEVKMIMQTVGIYDTLTLEKIPSGIELFVDHASLPADEHNLVYRAAKLMIDTYSIQGGVRMQLSKRIPIAAGMAGGSTDAAAAFRGMRELYEIPATDEELMRLAVKIGADVPYCIMGGTALSEGIGEILTPLPELPDAYLVIAKPDIDVSTAFVYGNLKLSEQTVHPDIDAQIAAIHARDLKQVAKFMGNVLETVTAPAYPVIHEIEELMLQHGAIQAMMSGSGPTVFGIFATEDEQRSAYEAIQEQHLAPQLFMTGFTKGEQHDGK